jgi:hypothetical protein
MPHDDYYAIENALCETVESMPEDALRKRLVSFIKDSPPDTVKMLRNYLE